MNRTFHYRLALLWLCGALAACTAPSKRPPAANASAAKSGAGRVVQFEHEGKLMYAVCQPPACPSVTPKTLADEDTAPVVATPETTPSHPAGPRMVVERVVVQFPSNSDRLDAAARATLDQVAEWLDQATLVLISGRTDSSGKAQANQRLAERRAERVRAYLAMLVPASTARTQVEARGNCCYVADNTHADGRKANRRVEVEIRSVPSTEKEARGRPRIAQVRGGQGVNH